MNILVPYSVLKVKATTYNEKVDSAQGYVGAVRFYELAKDHEGEIVLLKEGGCMVSLEDYLKMSPPFDKPVDLDFETGEEK